MIACVWSAVAHSSSADFESTILALGRDNAQLLFNRIFELPTELLPHDVGKLAVLPTGTTPLPREKPVSEGREGEREEREMAADGMAPLNESVRLEAPECAEPAVSDSNAAAAC
jgi:hypothetical protein